MGGPQRVCVTHFHKQNLETHFMSPKLQVAAAATTTEQLCAANPANINRLKSICLYYVAVILIAASCPACAQDYPSVG